MAPITSRYPLKAILTLLAIPFVPSYLVVLSLYYAPKRLRPHSEWGLHTALGNKLLRIFYKYVTLVRLQPKIYLKAGSLKDRFVLVQPGPSRIYSGILEHDHIKPAPVGAIWFPKPYRSEDKERKVVLHFQGGAFVTATDPDITGRYPTEIWAKKMDAITFYAQYRLSLSEHTRFPAALQDLVTFYQYLLHQGIDSSNIIISGDSAGGNLVIAFLRYIETTKVLPLPRGVMAWSPWVDLTDGAIEGYGKSPRIHTDFLNTDLLSWGKSAYDPESRVEAGEEVEGFLTPVNHPFKTSVPIFVQAGTAEIFYEEVGKFVENMRSVPGNSTHYVQTQRAPHDIMLSGNITGFTLEAESAVQQAKDFFGI